MLKKIVLSLILLLSPLLVFAQPSSSSTTFIMAVSDDTSTLYTTHLGFEGADVSQLGYKGIVTIPVATDTTGWTHSGDYIYSLTDHSVGIGTTLPTQKLDILGNMLASGTIAGNIITGTNVTSGLDPGHTHGSGSITEVDPNVDTASEILAIIDNTALDFGTGILTTAGFITSGTGTFVNLIISGNVGIGPTSLGSYKLRVTGGDARFDEDVEIAGNLNAVVDQTISGNVGLSGNLGVGITSPFSYRLQVGTTPSVPLLVVQDSGKVGIGMTNPSTSLDVNGVITATSGNSTNWNTAYTHSQDNTQAHSDYLLNSGDDSTSGILTAAGFITTGTGTFNSLIITIPIDISSQTNLSGDTENVLTGDALSIGSAITRDTEWNTIDFLIGTATGSLSGEIVAGTAPGGELGGTWASPTIDDSVAVSSWNLTTPTITTSLTTSTPTTLSVAELDRLDGLTSAIIDDDKIDTYSELNTIVADVTLTHNGLIDTFVELDTIVADKALVNFADGGTFTGNIIANGNLSVGNVTTSAGVLTLLEDDDDGSNYASFQVPALAANTVYTLPADDGEVDDVLSTNGSGVLDWVAAGTGDITAVGDALTGAVFAAGDSDSLLGNLVGIGSTAPTAFLNIKPTTVTPIFILKLADTSANDRLVVQSDGKVGIGKTNPGQALDVVGTIEGDVLTEATNAVPNATDNLSFFAATTSAQLAGVISDEQGSGSLVFATSPTLVTPTLGAAIATTLDTGQGANELYDMNQNVQTTDNVVFKTLKTSDTVPIMRLNIKSPDSTFNKVGSVYSTQKNMVIDKMEAICPTVASGTSVVFTLKTVGTDGTGPLTNLSVGQTAPLTKLTVTSFTGGTLPAGYGLIIDDITQVGGTAPIFRLEIFGHES